MRVSRSDRQTAAFIVNWSDIDGLISSIATTLPIITIAASCSDKLSRTFADIAELRAFRNSERTAITELAVTARTVDHSQRLQFTLSSDHPNNVRHTFDGEEADALRLDKLCEDFLDSVRPWYAIVAKANWTFILMGLLIAFYVGSLIVILLRAKAIRIDWQKDGLSAEGWVKSFVFGFAPLLLGGLLNALRNRYFPLAVFAFGDGEKRNARTEVVRTVIIGGFAVSVVASLLLSWLL
ncbi:MAG: hypothetical protein JWR22_4132 [Herminiimonas sp.]|nr:hypothetical protein [Herminiimonas sp.]